MAWTWGQQLRWGSPPAPRPLPQRGGCPLDLSPLWDGDGGQPLRVSGRAPAYTWFSFCSLVYFARFKPEVGFTSASSPRTSEPPQPPSCACAGLAHPEFEQSSRAAVREPCRGGLGCGSAWVSSVPAVADGSLAQKGKQSWVRGHRNICLGMLSVPALLRRDKTCCWWVGGKASSAASREGANKGPVAHRAACTEHPVWGCGGRDGHPDSPSTAGGAESCSARAARV